MMRSLIEEAAKIGYNVPFSTEAMRSQAFDAYLKFWQNAVTLDAKYDWNDVSTRLRESLYLPEVRSMQNLMDNWQPVGLPDWTESMAEEQKHNSPKRQDQGLCGNGKYVFIGQREYVWRGLAAKKKGKLLSVEADEREISLNKLAYLWKNWGFSYNHIGAITYYDNSVWLPIEADGKNAAALLLQLSDDLLPIDSYFQLFFCNPITGKWQEQNQCGWCAFNPLDGYLYTSMTLGYFHGIDDVHDKSLRQNVILVYDLKGQATEAARAEIAQLKTLQCEEFTIPMPGSGPRKGEICRPVPQYNPQRNCDLVVPRFVGVFPLGSFEEYRHRTGYGKEGIMVVIEKTNNELFSPMFEKKLYFFDDVSVANEWVAGQNVFGLVGPHYKIIGSIDVAGGGPVSICGGYFSNDGMLWLGVGNIEVTWVLEILGFDAASVDQTSFFSHIGLINGFDGKMIDWRAVGRQYSEMAAKNDVDGWYETEGLMGVGGGIQEIFMIMLYNSADVAFQVDGHDCWWRRHVVCVGRP